MTRRSSFDVRTPDDFFSKVVVPQYDEFIADNASSRKALVAIIVAYHMFEWVAGRKFAYPERNLSPAINNAFELARKLTNGVKHFGHTIETKTQSAFSSGFDESFARPLIVVQDDRSELSVDQLLREIVNYWRGEKTTGKF